MQMPRNGRPSVAAARGRPFETGGAQRLHACAERPDPREHHRVGVFDGSHIGGERGVGPEVLQGLLRRAQVADPVVDDRDHVESVPLVDGTESPPSRFTASRNARAAPLNDASMTW